MPQLPLQSFMDNMLASFKPPMSASEDVVEVRPPPPTSPDPFLEEQTVLILVGLIASGKVERQTIQMKPWITDLLYTSLLSQMLLRTISPSSAAVTRMTWVTDSELRNLPTTRFAKVARLASTEPTLMPCRSVRLAHTHSNTLEKTTVLLERDRPRVHENVYQHYCFRYPLSCENGNPPTNTSRKRC